MLVVDNLTEVERFDRSLGRGSHTESVTAESSKHTEECSPTEVLDREGAPGFSR